MFIFFRSKTTSAKTATEQKMNEINHRFRIGEIFIQNPIQILYEARIDTTSDCKIHKPLSIYFEAIGHGKL